MDVPSTPAGTSTLPTLPEGGTTMRKTLNALTLALLSLCALLVMLNLCGCSNTKDLETQISGKWQQVQGDGLVDINLTSDPKTLNINGQSYNAVVEKVDKGTYTVEVKVQTPAGGSEVWTLSQKWDDNGSSFKLAFRHNGTTETLQPVGQS
jgi:hypothetical protein